MINSPGGIQAGGNVTVNADRRFIQTLMLKVVMELETAPSTVTKPGDPTEHGLWARIGAIYA